MSVQKSVMPPVSTRKALEHADWIEKWAERHQNSTERIARLTDAGTIRSLAHEVERLRFEVRYGPLEEVYPYIYATLPFRMEIGGHPVVVRRVSPGNCLLAQTDGGDVWYDLSDDGWVKREPI